MNLIDLSIRRPVFAWVLMFGLIVFGAISMNRMGISQLPDVNFPVLSISVNYEGAAPEVVEVDLIDPIEERLLTIEGVKEMRSTARQGSGTVTLEFSIDRNIDVALQEVQSALSQLRLPTGIDPPTIRKQNPEEDPILILSVYGDLPLRELLLWADQRLLDQIRFLPGVGEVSIGGFSQRNLRVWMDPEKLAQNFLTLSDVVEAIRSQHVESAAGQFTEGSRELQVRWLGEADAVRDVEEITILKRGGQMIHNRNIRIKDVATVEDGLSDIRRVARVDGKTAVGVQIRKQRGTNEVDVADQIRAKLESIKDTFPPGVQYRVNVDFTRPTQATVKLSIEKLWIAALITILVCYLFLGSAGAALNVLFSIPTSLFGTFIILYFSGFTLNIFTLLALTLSISIVVDDAIMLLENIVRHRRMGKSPAQAASDGAKEVLPAATAATLAVIAVFLPVIFMEGVTGKFFFQFGITMSAAVALSLLEAVTITPMRAAAFLSTNEPTKFEAWLESFFEKCAHSYRRGLVIALKHKYVVFGGSMAIFGLSLFGFNSVRQEFVPSQDQNIIILNAQTPPGSSLEFTQEASKKVEEILQTEPEILGFMVSVGAGGLSQQINNIFMPLALKPKAERKSSHTEIMASLRAKFKELKGIRVTMRDISSRNLTAGRQNPVAMSLRGPDLEVLAQKSQELLKRLEEEKLAVDLDTDYKVGIPELVLVPNRLAMADRVISVEAVGQLLAAGVGGLREGRFTGDGRRYDIRFKIKDGYIRSRENLKTLFVRNAAGNLVPLSELVTVTEKQATQFISRINRSRSIGIFGNLYPGQSQGKVLSRAREIAAEILPKDGRYSLELEGASAGFSESFQSLTHVIWLGILFAYLVLATQFNSFIQPIIVLIALPFSVTGALVALWAFGLSINLFSLIGLIVLMGISKKNSILLVEFSNQMRTAHPNESFHDNLLRASPVRLRPILMTSVATLAAALPLVMGDGIGIETRAPMGWTIIGGTIVSTIFTLYVVPALSLILAPLERRSIAP